MRGDLPGRLPLYRRAAHRPSKYLPTPPADLLDTLKLFRELPDDPGDELQVAIEAAIEILSRSER